MPHYTGRLQAADLDPSSVVIDISDDERFRIAAGRKHLGSWPTKSIHAERTSIYRFELTIDGVVYEFFPDDPSAFSDKVGAVIDLTESKGRFGLKARIDRAANS